MKITIESYDKKYSTELNYEDCTMDEYIEIFTGLLISSGFDISTVRDGFREYLDIPNMTRVFKQMENEVHKNNSNLNK